MENSQIDLSTPDKVKKWMIEQAKLKYHRLKRAAREHPDIDMDPQHNFHYFARSFPMALPHDEKLFRMECFGDTVLRIDEGDIVCLAMWIPMKKQNNEEEKSIAKNNNTTTP